MVMCERCNQEMILAVRCVADEPRIRYGMEGFGFDDLRSRCVDCATTIGGIHHLGCDNERCPICGADQRLWCEHNGYDYPPPPTLEVVPDA